MQVVLWHKRGYYWLWIGDFLCFFGSQMTSISQRWLIPCWDKMVLKSGGVIAAASGTVPRYLLIYLEGRVRGYQDTLRAAAGSRWHREFPESLCSSCPAPCHGVSWTGSFEVCADVPMLTALKTAHIALGSLEELFNDVYSTQRLVNLASTGITRSRVWKWELKALELEIKGQLFNSEGS